jgi:polar amino acid transport system substrate-binding protein
MRIFWLLTLSILVLPPCQLSEAATLTEIKQRGEIVIGVKADYKPWGYKDENGDYQGMEIELARDIADRLQVKLTLVPALSSNRVQLLNDGKADVIVATFSVTEERKKQVAFIEPSYYAAMTALLTAINTQNPNIDLLHGRKICAVAGNYSNKSVAALAGRDLSEHKTLLEAEEKLLSGECDALNFDDVALLYEIKSNGEKWKGYDISPLISVKPALWGLAVPLPERDGELAKFLSETILDWHRRGDLLRLEKKWLGENSMALQWLSSKVKGTDTALEAGAVRNISSRRD